MSAAFYEKNQFFIQTRRQVSPVAQTSESPHISWNEVESLFIGVHLLVFGVFDRKAASEMAQAFFVVREMLDGRRETPDGRRETAGQKLRRIF